MKGKERIIKELAKEKRLFLGLQFFFIFLAIGFFLFWYFLRFWVFCITLFLGVVGYLTELSFMFDYYFPEKQVKNSDKTNTKNNQLIKRIEVNESVDYISENKLRNYKYKVV